MKGTFTLALHIAIGTTGAAFGQAKPPNVFEYATSPTPIVAVPIAPTVRDRSGAPVSMGATSVSPNWKPVAIVPTPAPATPVPPPQDIKPPVERVVMTFGAGGRIVDHRMTFEGYFRSGTKVELRGPCYSACTLLLGYLEKANLCIAPGAFMAFHAVRGEKRRDYMVGQTRAMYESFPPEVRRWIDDNGGWHNLPLDGCWTMYDRTLWAFGYPRCAP